jgi:sugar phosphate isomerase/epimerase
MKPRILFVGAGNIDRSQMAEEALVRESARGAIEVCGAGERPDWVVTLGERARVQCPELPGNPWRLHWPLDDLPDSSGTPMTEPAVLRRALDAMEDRLPGLIRMATTRPSARELDLQPGISTVVTGPRMFDPLIDLPRFVSVGFRVIELCLARDTEEFPWRDPGTIRSLRKAAEGHGVTIWSVHAPSVDNQVAAVDARVRQRFVDTLRRTLDVAEELGARVVPFHTGLSPDRVKAGSHSKAAMRSSLEAVAEHARSLACVPGWENAPPGWVDFEPEEIVHWILAMPADGMGFVCDTGHANLLGGDLEGYLPRLASRLASWHFNDNNGKEDIHLLPGRGTLDGRAVRKLREEMNYVGPLILEVWNDRDELQEFLHVARGIAATL